MTCGWSPSIAAITEFVVPRSMPTALPMTTPFTGSLCQGHASRDPGHLHPVNGCFGWRVCSGQPVATGEMGVSGSVVGEHVVHAKGRGAEPDGEPRDGAWRVQDNRPRLGEEVCEFFFFARQRLERHEFGFGQPGSDSFALGTTL